jgi:hypothetical protein
VPAYAPELNPLEAVRNWLESGPLANFVPDDSVELDDEIIGRLIHLRCDPKLLRALRDGSELPFPEHLSW